MTARIWRWSRAAHWAGHPHVARALKALVFVLCHAVLPPQVDLGDDVVLYHHGLGVVVHPRTTIGDRVTLAHGVTVAVAGDGTGSVVIEHDAHIGAHAVLLSTGGKCLRIGAGSSIGANALVIADVPPGGRALAPAATIRDATFTP